MASADKGGQFRTERLLRSVTERRRHGDAGIRTRTKCEAVPLLTSRNRYNYGRFDFAYVPALRPVMVLTIMRYARTSEHIHPRHRTQSSAQKVAIRGVQSFCSF